MKLLSTRTSSSIIRDPLLIARLTISLRRLRAPSTLIEDIVLINGVSVVTF